MAYKSRNINNSKEDFSQYNDDDIMAEVIKRIEKDKLSTEEYKFISDMPLYEAYYSNMQLEAQEKAENAEKKVQFVEQKLLKGIENLLQRGETIESIADLLDFTIEETRTLVAQVKAKKG